MYMSKKLEKEVSENGPEKEKIIFSAEKIISAAKSCGIKAKKDKGRNGDILVLSKENENGGYSEQEVVVPVTIQWRKFMDENALCFAPYIYTPHAGVSVERRRAKKIRQRRF